MSTYMKAILAAAVPVIAAIGSWLSTGTIDSSQLALAITGLVTAILVAIVRNQEAGLLSALKFIVAATTPLLSALIQGVVTGGFNRAELATIVVGVLTSILVYLSANAPESTKEPGTVR